MFCGPSPIIEELRRSIAYDNPIFASVTRYAAGGLASAVVFAAPAWRYPLAGRRSIGVGTAMIWRPLLVVPVRFLVPMLFTVAALLAIGANHQLQVKQTVDVARFGEQKRLLEHLGIERARLEREWELGHLSRVRGLVTGLALLGGITHAWLVDEAGRIVAALSLTELGQPLTDILAKQSPGLRAAIETEKFDWHSEIHVRPIQGEHALLAEVGIQPKLLLLVRLDLQSGLAGQLALGQDHLMRQAGLIVLLAILLGGLLHVLWFRRAAHLSATAIAMGEGNFELRARMEGHDELATIGAALDSLAVKQQLYQAELRQLLRKLDTIANASPVLFWSSRPDKGCKWFNQRWLDFTGRGMAQEQGNGWLEGMHPEDADGFWTVYHQAFAERKPFSVEYRLRRHDGEYRWLLNHGMPRYDADGYFLGYIGSCLDISDQKQLNERLAGGEAHYRYLFEHNPAPMLIFERVELRLMSVNQAFLQHYGYSLEDALAFKLADLYPASEQAAIIKSAGQPGGDASNGEWHHRKQNGEFMDIVAHSHDLVYAGQACGVMVISDITERKRAELILQQRNQELERFNDASVDRELAMIDLKRRINELSQQLGQPRPYDLSFTEASLTRPDSGSAR